MDNNIKKRVSGFSCDAGTWVFIIIAIVVTAIGVGKVLMEKTRKVDVPEDNEKFEVTTTVAISSLEYQTIFRVDGYLRVSAYDYPKDEDDSN